METIADKSNKGIGLIGSLLLVSIFCFFGLMSVNSFVLAEAEVNEIAKPVLLPNSPLYFLKDIGREIQSFFVFNPTKKAELRLEFTNQKIIEAKKIYESDPTNTIDLAKALDNYANETEKLKQATSNLKKDSVASNQLLTKITAQNFNHQQILKQISGIADKVKLQATQTKAMENFVASSFELASPALVQKNIQDNFNKDLIFTSEKISKLDVVTRMDTGATTAIMSEVIKMQDSLLQQSTSSPLLSNADKLKFNQYIEEIQSKPEFQKAILEDFANNIVSQNQAEINQLNTISEEDKVKLKAYAEQILSAQNINLNDALVQFEALDISPEAKQTINSVTNKIVNKNINLPNTPIIDPNK